MQERAQQLGQPLPKGIQRGLLGAFRPFRLGCVAHPLSCAGVPSHYRHGRSFVASPIGAEEAELKASTAGRGHGR